MKWLSCQGNVKKPTFCHRTGLSSEDGSLRNGRLQSPLALPGCGRDLNTQLVGSAALAHPAAIPALLCHLVLANCQYTASWNELAARYDRYNPSGLNLESIIMHKPVCAIWRTYKQETWVLECCTIKILSVFLWRSRSPWMFLDVSVITGIVLSSLQVRSSSKICIADISHYCY